jgi:hypothetical protein
VTYFGFRVGDSVDKMARLQTKDGNFVREVAIKASVTPDGVTSWPSCVVFDKRVFVKDSVIDVSTCEYSELDAYVATSVDALRSLSR